MKKILVSLLVLALCAPAMAATVGIVSNGDGTGTITVTAAAAVNIVGLGLNIDVQSGGNITAATVDTGTFDIFPDAAHDLEVAVPGSYTYGAGTPIAIKDGVGEAAISNNFAISVGALNGADIAGATGSATVVITVTVDADTTICVEENAIRGGIVLTDGTGEDIDGTTVCALISGGSACVGAADLAEWQAVGEPDSWCAPSQCYGDADGQFEQIGKGSFAVGFADIDILLEGFSTAYPSPADPIANPWIAADFDRAAEQIGKGSFRVGFADIDILLAWFSTAGVPTDCND